MKMDAMRQRNARDRPVDRRLSGVDASVYPARLEFQHLVRHNDC